MSAAWESDLEAAAYWPPSEPEPVVPLSAVKRLCADEVERLRKLIAAYFVEVARAPNNRDEAAIDAASRALVAEVMPSG